MIYAWRYPKSIHRSVMIGVNPPGNFLWYPKTTDEQIAPLRRALRARRRLQHAHAATSPRRSADASRTIPDRWVFLPIKHGNAQIGAFFGLFHATTAGRADLLAADDRHVALRRQGRRERRLVPVA